MHQHNRSTGPMSLEDIGALDFTETPVHRDTGVARTRQLLDQLDAAHHAEVARYKATTALLFGLLVAMVAATILGVIL